MSDVTETIDGLLGYNDGQRSARVNPYLSGPGLRNVGIHRLHDTARLLTLDRRQFLRGFRHGYFDELNGLAGPLPEEGNKP